MRKTSILLLSAIACTAVAIGCGGGGEGDPTPGTPSLTGSMEVNAAASVGDLFTYTLDFDNLSYVWQGVEGTYAGTNGGGVLTPQTGWGNRVFETDDGDTVLVLPDKLMLIETDDGEFLAGVPQRASDYSPGDIVGRYNYVWWGGDLGGFTYGTFDVNIDGTYQVHELSNGGTVTASGLWEDQGNGVIYAYESTGTTKLYNVMIHPAGGESILVVDDIQENGMAIGVRQRALPAVAGTFNLLSSDADSMYPVTVNGGNVTTPEGTSIFAPDTPWTGFGYAVTSDGVDSWEDWALMSPSGYAFGGGYDDWDDWIWVAIQR